MMRTTTPILSLLTAILLFVFFTRPEYMHSTEIKNEIKEYKIATESYKEFTKTLEEKIFAKASRSAYEIERLNTLIPAKIDETQHLVDLEALAESNSLLFGNISVEGGVRTVKRPVETKGKTAEVLPSNELQVVNISFEVVGTYEQFKAFLEDLETSLTIYEVVSMALTTVEGPFQQFAMTVRTYALPQ